MKNVMARADFAVAQLESRLLMATTPISNTLVHGLLTINATGADDNISIAQSGNTWTMTDNGITLVRTYAATALVVNAGAGNDTVTIDSSVVCLVTVTGGAGNDVLIASSGKTSLNGGAGDDSLVAGTGNDILVGDVGNDTLVGNTGNDSLYGSAGNDSITGAAGNDFIQGGLGNDSLSGGDGTDTIDYSDHTASQKITLNLDGTGTDGMIGEADTIAADFEIANGSAGNDSINGTANADSINGGAGNDTIEGFAGNDSINGGAGNDSLVGDDGADVLYGNDGNDFISGGADNDSIYGNAGNDSSNGGDGDDLLISIGGGTLDTLAGGNGNDEFWLDSNTTENVTDASGSETTGAVHRVDVFQSLKGVAVSKEIAGQALTDPSTLGGGVTYRNFKTNSLFASGGPTLADIQQGQCGDCYFLAQLGSFAQLDSTLIKHSIVALGDGSFAVQFARNSKEYFYRIDADLPSTSSTHLAYANFGAENSIWAPLMEKAWTFFRSGKGTYASIQSGNMSEVAGAMGKSNSFGYVSSTVAATLASLETAITAGQSVTVGTFGSQASDSIIIGGHAYVITAITDDGAGNYQITVRNPWKVDGYVCADGVNDGFVTLTNAQFASSMQWYVNAAA